MFVVDTNIFLYAANKNAAEHEICREFILQCRQEATPWHITWGIVYEFLRVATHPRVFPNPMDISQAWQFIQSILASQSLSVLVETERHPVIAPLVFKSTSFIYGNIVFDTHTAIIMKEHGIKRIYTRDNDFHKFSFLEVIDPLK